MRIDNYRVHLFNRNINYGRLGRCFTTAQINLGGPILIFFDPDKTPTVPTSRGGDDALIFLPRDQYVPHLDILRNEGPLDLVTDDSIWTFGSLRTFTEPVGEGE